ncbi:MAG: asparagine synthase (glutamine-hydrolyzing) [Candidatus Omnitrophota bacterium]
MCGICGISGFKNKELLIEMNKALCHRGPDDEGYYFGWEREGERCKIGLGVRRLKIIDLETGDQPIHNEDETIWIVYNGEIYNFKELKAQLQTSGHKFYTHTDTEVIVHLYEDEGKDCVKKLRGMFAFAIWDKRKGELILARDRLGIKPLYYFFHNGNLIFASEIKSIIKDNRIKREVDFKALDYYIKFLYVPAPLTIFKGINKLLPGHILLWTEGKVSIESYWDLNIPKSKTEYAEEYYTRRLYELLEESVRLELISDVPLGAFLSGGRDSSTVVALMTKFSNKPVKTFSIGYEEKNASYNELKKARFVANYFGCEHEEFIVKPDVIELLPELVSCFDEPFADSSAIPTYLISRLSKKKITVALTGIGGDELFAGYPRYIGVELSRIYEKFPLLLRQKFSKLIERLPESTKSGNIPGRIKRFIKGGILPFEERYLSWVSFFKNAELMNLYSQEVRSELEGRESNFIHKDYFAKVSDLDLLDRVFYVDVKTYLCDDLLTIGDRVSMANSLELRVPLCDHKLLEFSADIPSRLRLKGLSMKYLLRKATSGLLPKEVLNQKKQGFMVPLARWIQDELRPQIEEYLSEKNVKSRGYFNYNYVRHILDLHYQGRINFADQIWALLVLEIWHRAYL